MATRDGYEPAVFHGKVCEVKIDSALEREWSVHDRRWRDWVKSARDDIDERQRWRDVWGVK